MHPTHARLYDRLERFPIDDGEAALSFEARLAEEQHWPFSFARRVTAEYRRFLFLAATAAEPVTPSLAVDEAWHLHLTYTRSYWDRLCGDVLGKPLHHDPTRGGPAEMTKHRRQYERTLAEYRNAFGQEPPADVWGRPEGPPPRRARGRGWRVLYSTAAIGVVATCVGCGLVSDESYLCFLVFGLAAAGLAVGGFARQCRREMGPRKRRKGSGDGGSGGWFFGGGCGSGGDSSGGCGDGGGGSGGACCGGGGSGCGGGGGGGGCGGGS